MKQFSNPKLCFSFFFFFQFSREKKMLINKQVGVCLVGCFSYSAEKVNYSHSPSQYLEGNSQYIKGLRLFICLESRIIFYELGVGLISTSALVSRGWRAAHWLPPSWPETRPISTRGEVAIGHCWAGISPEEMLTWGDAEEIIWMSAACCSGGSCSAPPCLPAHMGYGICLLCAMPPQQRALKLLITSLVFKKGA